MSGLLGIATSGVLASQRSLNTTGHNIANVNTDGYSRQRVELSENRPAEFTGDGFVGSGVEIVAITRSYDDFLNNQVRTSTSTSSGLEAFYNMATQVDKLIADPDASLTPALQTFFNSVQGVSNDPTSIAARQVMLQEGDGLAQRFNLLDSRLSDIRSQTNNGLQAGVDDVNALTSDIANMNQRIVLAWGQSGGRQPPNDLMDQRNVLLEKLSKQIDTQVVPQEDGSLNVFIGTGQALVMGANAASLKIQPSVYDSNQKDITLSAGGNNSVVITGALTGGNLGGLLDFGKRVLDPAQNALGRVATGFAMQFNAQHQAGYNLDGGPTGTGNSFFAAPTIMPLAKPGNTGTMLAAVTNANQLTAHDYQIDMTAGGISVVDLQTSKITSYPTTTPGYPVIVHEGVQLDMTAANVNDSFVVQPTRHAAGDIKTLLTDPRKIAAAAADTAGGAVGDNKNALALSKLQTALGLINGKASFQDAYSAMVGDVGSMTHGAEVNSAAQKNLLEHAREARDTVSGVNLDEEAANLIKFQQSYQAAAQLISVATSTFDALIGAVR